MIELNVTKRLRHFDLQVEVTLGTAGQAGRGAGCVALVGPTGCGKTTTLRLIAGLELPDSGRIAIDDRVLVDTARGLNVPVRQRRVGLVFQDYALFPHMDVLQNVVYGIVRHGRSRREVHEQALAILRRVQLQGLERARPTALSGGQQQRVALARAIAGAPAVLLMDEPLSALDPTVRRQVRSELKDFIAELGIQTIVVTHDVVDALTLGDTICVMDEGRIIQVGDRRELLSRPRNTFVAEFLGVNLVNCLAGPAAEEGLYEATCGDVRFYTFDAAEGEALLRCDPWDVSVSRQRPQGSALNVMRGKVTQLAHIGGRTRVTIENGISLVAELTHLSEEQLNLRPGDEVYASFKASATHVYH